MHSRRCVNLWPGLAPNETDVPKTPPENRTPNDGEGCGQGRDEPCDHINDVSQPSLTPFLVTNGTGAAIIIAPGGGYHDLAWSKEGVDVAHMYNSIGVSASLHLPRAVCPQRAGGTNFAKNHTHAAVELLRVWRATDVFRLPSNDAPSLLAGLRAQIQGSSAAEY